MHRLLFAGLAMLAGRPALSAPNLTDVADVAVSTNIANDNALHGGTLYLLRGRKAEVIFRDRYGILSPAFSPDGARIAFERTVPMTVADAEIVVIDRKGRVLAANLINRHHPGQVTADMHQISNLSWMGTRLSVTAAMNSDHAIVMIFTPSRSNDPDAATEISDHPPGALTSFVSTGDVAASPGGAHVVSVEGLDWHGDYTSCSGFVEAAPRPASGLPKTPVPADANPTSATLEIDGAPMPDLSFPFTPVSAVSWYDDTRFSVIVREKVGFQVLTVGHIPAHWTWNASRHTTWGIGYTPPANARTVSFDLVRIPVPAADVPHFVMQGYVGPDKTYNIVVYKRRSAAIVARYAMSGGRLVPAGIGQRPDTLANSRPTQAGREKIIDNVADVLVANGVDARHIQNFGAFCHDRSCAPLADRGEGAANARLDGVVSLPPVCVPR